MLTEELSVQQSKLRSKNLIVRHFTDSSQGKRLPLSVVSQNGGRKKSGATK